MRTSPSPLQGFRDRRHAGEVLASRLERYRGAADTVVLALPRGGIVPAAVVADRLDLPLDVLVSRKLRAPFNPELAIGAIAEGGEPFFYDASLETSGATREYIRDEVAGQRREIAARQRLFRDGRPLDLAGANCAILVDDGIATGSTVIAAVAALRAMGVGRIVLAAPVAPGDTAQRLGRLVEELVVPLVPGDFGAVSAFYDRFDQVADEEVVALLRGARRPGRATGQPRATAAAAADREIAIPLGGSVLHGVMHAGEGARGIVLFVHGSGSGRHSPRNLYVAHELQREGLATLLVDLLTEEEARRDERTAEHRFDIGLLSRRVGELTQWLVTQPGTRDLDIGYFGASTGAAAALVAAAAGPRLVHAVVSRGGRPDLAGDALPEVSAPTLLVVGSQDIDVLELNRRALARLRCTKRLSVVPGATHLFEEEGTLEQVAALARAWFAEHLRSPVHRGSGATGGRHAAR